MANSATLQKRLAHERQVLESANRLKDANIRLSQIERDKQSALKEKEDAQSNFNNVTDDTPFVLQVVGGIFSLGCVIFFFVTVTGFIFG